VLDKTGTITTGTMAVAALVTADGTSRAQLLYRAGAVEQASEHAVAAAITEAARADTAEPGEPADAMGPGEAGEVSKAGQLPQPDDFAALPGLGARGTVDGVPVTVGRAKLLTDAGFVIPAALSAQATKWEQAGLTTVLAGWDGQARGVLAVADTVKPSAAPAVAELRRLGLRTVLLTGDNEATGQAVGALAGVDEVIAGALPADKAAVVSAMRTSGHAVAMVGDGVNDGPALAAATLGIALGSGTDVAISAADLILLRDDLMAVPESIRLARGTFRGYNAAAIPLAAAGFLNPLIAAAAMTLSSAFVVWNSLRLRSLAVSAPGAAAGQLAAQKADPPGEALSAEDLAADSL
jgi:P-type Cu+ transporter